LFSLNSEVEKASSSFSCSSSFSRILTQTEQNNCQSALSSAQPNKSRTIFFGALALLQILGGHWALLQTSAWLGMIVQCSQRAGLKAGLVQTFDGEHPCPVCKAIQETSRLK
jgi:hypothetical protein